MRRKISIDVEQRQSGAITEHRIAQFYHSACAAESGAIAHTSTGPKSHTDATARIGRTFRAGECNCE